MIRLALIALLVSACNYHEAKGGGPLPTGDVAYSDVREHLLAPYCLRCHSGPHAAAGYDLSTPEGTLVHVVPGDVAGSYLFERSTDGTMPPAGAMPDDALLELLRAWIENGAAL